MGQFIYTRLLQLTEGVPMPVDALQEVLHALA